MPAALPEPDPFSPVAVLAVACDVAAIALLLFLVVSRIYYSELFHASRGLESDRIALIMLAAGFLVLRRLSRRLGTRGALVAFSLGASTSVALIICLIMAIDVADAITHRAVAIEQAFVGVVHPATAGPSFYDEDERYGRVHRANARHFEQSPDFAATYTIDATGHRVMPPAPEHSKATIVFVGDSFTFGEGVNDDEPYPYVLAAQYWPDVTVVNAGVSGWGLTQTYLTVMDTLSRPAPPDVIVAAMIPNDLRRSYLREDSVAPPVKRRLEFFDGALVLREVSPGQVPPADDAELLEKELQMNRWMLLSMSRACEEKHVGFGVLLFASTDLGQFPPDLIYDLGASRIPVVDLTRIKYERFAHDAHPNAADHRRLANAISTSVVADMLYGRVSMRAPSRESRAGLK